MQKVGENKPMAKMVSGTTYKTSTLASVYTLKTDLYGAQSMQYSGYIEEGTTLSCGGSIEISGTEYGLISGSGTFYKQVSTQSRANANGLYVIASAVVEYSNGNSTITTSNGTTISGIQKVSNPVTYTVKSTSKFITRSGPGNSYSPAGTYVGGQTIMIYATYKDSTGLTWGAVNTDYTMWGILRYTSGQLTSSLTENTPVEEDTSISSPSDDETMIDMQAVADQVARNASNNNFSDESLEGLHNMQYVIGIPPHITRTADPQYMLNESPSNNFGRAYTEMYMMGNTVFSIQPMKVKYLPGFTDEERGWFFSTIADRVGNLADDAGIENQLTGQLFEGQPDYNQYINTVNMLARVMAIYLGIGDRQFQGTGDTYRQMDYSWYKIRDNSHRTQSNGSGVFGIIESGVRWAADKLVTSAINDDTYIHFYMTADGTGMSESLSVSTKSSSLESLFNNNLSSLAQEIQFLTGGESSIDFANEVIDSVGTAAYDIAGNFSTTLQNLVQYGANYLQGGRLVFPQMLDDCTYDRTYRGTCRFVSPSGDPEAIFLNCYLPLAYLMPYVMPQMLSDNMYKYPFLARINAKGLFHCDLAAITSLDIQRGGQDGTCWTADGLPFEVDVSFNVTPLYSKLMVTSARHPVLFLSNSALHEYLGAMCGVSFTGEQHMLKLNILETVLGNYLRDTIPSMLRGYYSTNVAEWLRRLFNF